MKKILILLIIIIFSFSNVFSQTDAGLKDYYKDYFPIGVAVNPRMMDAGKESALILAQFNSMASKIR